VFGCVRQDARGTRSLVRDLIRPARTVRPTHPHGTARCPLLSVPVCFVCRNPQVRQSKGARGFFGGWGTPFTLLRRECVVRTGFPGIVVLQSTDLLERCVHDDPGDPPLEESAPKTSSTEPPSTKGLNNPPILSPPDVDGRRSGSWKGKEREERKLRSRNDRTREGGE